MLVWDQNKQKEKQRGWTTKKGEGIQTPSENAVHLKYLSSLYFVWPTDSRAELDTSLSPSGEYHTCWSCYSSLRNFSTSPWDPPHRSGCRGTSHSNEWWHKGQRGHGPSCLFLQWNRQAESWHCSLTPSPNNLLDTTLTHQGRCHTPQAEFVDFSADVVVPVSHSHKNCCRRTIPSIRSLHIFLSLKLR